MLLSHQLSPFKQLQLQPPTPSPLLGGENQTVQVQVQADGSGSGTNPCVSGMYNDHDDVIFRVVMPSQTTQLMTSCLPRAKKVRSHHSSYELFKTELEAFSKEDVNVAEGKTVTEAPQPS